MTENEEVHVVRPTERLLDISDAKAKTRSHLTYFACFLLFAVIFGHYFVILYVSRDAAHGKEQAEIVKDVFDKVLPVITGLFGTVMGFYFKDSK